MDSKPEETKHDKGLAADGDKTATEAVELIKNKFTPNIASPFINHQKSWDDEEHFKIPDDIRKNIEDLLKFSKPSNIQAVSIPLIVAEPYHDLIAQARNGCGKTGSFTIGSVLRVDRNEPRCQVLCVVNTRELANQIHAVYEKLVQGTGITLGNFLFDSNPQQIVVTTHGKLEPMLKGRKPLDLLGLKCLVVDEADVFFLDEKNFQSLKNISNYKHIKERKEGNKI